MRPSTDHLLAQRGRFLDARILEAVNLPRGGLHDVVEPPTKLTLAMEELVKVDRMRIFAVNEGTF